MFEFNAERFSRALTMIADARIGFRNIQRPPQQTADGDYSGYFTETLDVRKLSSLGDDLKGIDAGLAKKSVERLITYIEDCKQPGKGLSMEEVSRLLNEIEGRVKDQLDGKRFLNLSELEATRFDAGSAAFGTEVQKQFPDTAYDIDEAAKCLALGRSTASVFHLMRVAELTLKAVARCLNVQEPKSPNWGTWLKAIREACEAQKPGWEERELFMDIYARLDAVRIAHRNPSMHAESKYTEAEAEAIFIVLKLFVEKVASRMDQSGQPLTA